jgi:hypothetical protein
MLPSSTHSDHADSSKANIEISSDCAVRFPALSATYDFQYLRFNQFVTAMQRTLLAMGLENPTSMKAILAAGNVLKIVECRVSLIAIFVIDFMICRFRPKESGRNEYMDKVVFAVGKSDAWIIAVAFTTMRLEHMKKMIMHSAKVANPIQSFKSRQFTPYFNHV